MNLSGKKFYARNRAEWRDWLSKNYDKEIEVWLVKYNKASGKPCISYDESVEEALCFGWIDGIQKGNDSESSIQRFTPRRPKSNWSELNKERVRRLIKGKLMTPAGMKVLEGVDLEEKPAVMSPETENALKADPEVWNNYQAFDDLYKRLRIYYIEDAKRQKRMEEYERRLNSFIKATKKNRKIGTIL
jgi:uncharacterized protein YdeI (YjbR/CyaY-like superfamily)